MSRRYLSRRRGNLEGYLRPAQTVADLVRRPSTDIEDRSVVFVEEVQGLYAFNRTSTTPPDGMAVLLPEFGSGRWHLIDTAGAEPPPPPADHSIVHDTFTTDTVTVGARQQILVYGTFTIDPDTVLALEDGGDLIVL